MKLGISTAAAMLALFQASSGLAGKVHPAPRKLTGKKLSAFVLMHSFDDGHFSYAFKKGGVFTGDRPHLGPVNGTWKVNGGVLTVKAMGEGGRFDFKWHDARLTSTGIFVAALEEGGFAFRCDEKHCNGITASMVRPGHGNTGLFEKVLKKLASYRPEEVIHLKGSPVRNPRPVTEIWYQKGSRNEAVFLAKFVEEIVGPVEVKEWEWGTPYLTITIVGEKKAP